MKCIAFLLILGVVSCSKYDYKKVSPQEIVSSELKALNWTEVDEYPNFKSCAQLNLKSERKQCFSTTLSNRISTYLSSKNLRVTKVVSDTVIASLLISNNGTVSLDSLKVTPLFRQQVPAIDSLVNHVIRDMPTLLPAIKRGQKVTSVIQLPIVISAK